MRALTAAGLFAGADAGLTSSSRWGRSTRPGVVFCHSGGGSPYRTVDAAGIAKQVRALVDELGCVVAGTILGNQFWGNPASVTSARGVRTAIQTAPVTASVPSADWRANAGKVGILATSQGAATALSWAADHLDEVSWVVALSGIFDLDDVRNNDRNSARAQIDAAWSVTYPAALPANANPALRTATLAAFPFLGYIATDDPYDPGGTAMSTFATVIGGEMHTVGALGHTDGAVGAADTNRILAFVQAHA